MKRHKNLKAQQTININNLNKYQRSYKRTKRLLAQGLIRVIKYISFIKHFHIKPMHFV